MDKTSVPETKQVDKVTPEKLYDFVNDADDCISLLQTAFIYNKSSPLQECNTKASDIQSSEISLTKRLTEASRENQDLRKYISIPSHLFSIAQNIGNLSELIHKKIEDNVLFSDKAVNELMFLLQRLSEMLIPAADIILARNIFLSQYVQESQAGVEKKADEYATMHEERLIRGECLPVSSSLFIGMLDAIKGIAWHTKEITVKLTG